MILGSTGGGGLFAIRKAERDLLHLAPGLVEAGTYYGDFGNARVVAANFAQFLSSLKDDLSAFVNGDVNHSYMA